MGVVLFGERRYNGSNWGFFTIYFCRRMEMRTNVSGWYNFVERFNQRFFLFLTILGGFI